MGGFGEEGERVRERAGNGEEGGERELFSGLEKKKSERNN